ncbi:MAG: ATP phosphoribosyltransferase regulatory subunit, partial [Desulfobacteraceae bacterium]
MSKVNPSKGMRDFLPSEKRVRESVIKKIRKVYTSFGYDEIETPALENIKRLLSSDGGENLSLIFSTLKRGLDPDDPILPINAVDLGLRYDLTVPLARYYASNHSNLPDVFRAIQIGPVWRGERPQKGRFRQFTQCDIDIIGLTNEQAEVELISVTVLALNELNIKNITVRLNDRKLLVSFLLNFGFPSELHSSILISIDKLDKVGPDGVVAELNRKFPESSGSISKLSSFLKMFSTLEKSGEYAFSDAAKLLPSSTSQSLLDTLENIMKNVIKGVPETSIR